MPAFGAVDAARAAGFQVREDVGPDVLRLAGHDGVGVAQRLLGGEGHPRAAEHDLLAARAEVVREVVRPADLRSHRGDADDVGLALDPRDVQVGHELVGEVDPVRRRRERLQVG